MPASLTINPTLQILWSFRRLFLWALCLTFIVLAAATFALPDELATIRSSIEIGSSIVNQRQEPFEPADQVARRVSDLYVPAALSELERKGASPSVLRALRTSTVEGVGRSLVLVSMIDARAENEAKEFQRIIADQLITAQSQRARLIRDAITERIATAKAAAVSFSEQSSAAAKEIERINLLTKDLGDQIERQRAGLSNLTGSKEDAPANRLQEQISSEMISLAYLTIERAKLTGTLLILRQQSDAQAGLLAQAQLDDKALSETRVSLPPRLTSMEELPRRLRLLFIAFTTSILIAFGTAILLHRVTETRS